MNKAVRREKETEPKKKTVLKAMVPENILNLIRRRCLLIRHVVKMLEYFGCLIDDISILMRNKEGETIWLYKSPENRFKVFVDSHLIPVDFSFPQYSVRGGLKNMKKKTGTKSFRETKEIESPSQGSPDIVMMSPIQGHIISIDCSSWKREGAGLKKTA